MHAPLTVWTWLAWNFTLCLLISSHCRLEMESSIVHLSAILLIFSHSSVDQSWLLHLLTPAVHLMMTVSMVVEESGSSPECCWNPWIVSLFISSSRCLMTLTCAQMQRRRAGRWRSSSVLFYDVNTNQPSTSSLKNTTPWFTVGGLKCFSPRRWSVHTSDCTTISFKKKEQLKLFWPAWLLLCCSWICWRLRGGSSCLAAPSPSSAAGGGTGAADTAPANGLPQWSKQVIS